MHLIRPPSRPARAARTLEGSSSQFVMARFNRTELLRSPGLLDLSEESSKAVVWGWQNYSATAIPEVPMIAC